MAFVPKYSSETRRTRLFRLLESICWLVPAVAMTVGMRLSNRPLEMPMVACLISLDIVFLFVCLLTLWYKSWGTWVIDSRHVEFHPIGAKSPRRVEWKSVELVYWSPTEAGFREGSLVIKIPWRFLPRREVAVARAMIEEALQNQFDLTQYPRSRGSIKSVLALRRFAQLVGIAIASLVVWLGTGYWIKSHVSFWGRPREYIFADWSLFLLYGAFLIVGWHDRLVYLRSLKDIHRNWPWRARR